MVHPQIKGEYDASKELIKQPSVKASPIPFFKNVKIEELVKQQFQNELEGMCNYYFGRVSFSHNHCLSLEQSVKANLMAGFFYSVK